MRCKGVKVVLMLALSVTAAALSFTCFPPNRHPDFPCIIKLPDRVNENSNVSRTIKLPNGVAPKKIVLVLCPHPDDEYEGWAALADDETPVFMILTLGEKTRHCKKISALDCKTKRIDSVTYFLEKMMTRPYGLMIMDMGDLKLTRAGIRQAVRSAVKEYKPEKVIVAAYANEISGCTVYKHRDHEILYDTMSSGTWEVPVYLRVASCVQSPKKTMYVDEKVHRQAWGDGGFGQRAYGWLHGGNWPVGESDKDGISFFTRRQDFVVIEPVKR